MAHQTPLQHQTTRSPTANAQAARTAGPRQAGLSALESTLNTAPRVQQLKALEATVQPPPNRTGLPMPVGLIQRRIVQQPAGFAVQGRLAGHDSAANKLALSAKLRTRQAGAVNAGAPHAQNNFLEAGLHARAAGGPGGPANFISGNLRVPNLGISLAICHKMSSEAVQQEIARAANAGLPALQNTAQSLILGIAPPTWGVAANAHYQVFLNTCRAHSNGATALLGQIAGGGAALNAANLTRLAGLIANSPANLFIGDGSTNSTIQSRGDFNSTNILPPAAVAGRMRRTLTPDSATLRASIQAAITAGHIPANTDLNPITLAQGRAAAAGTNRQAWAAQIPAFVPGDEGALSSAVARDYTML